MAFPVHHLLYCPCVPRHYWRHNWLSRHKESPFHHLLYCPCVPRHCWRHNWLSRHKESLHPRDPFASPHVPETEMRALQASTWSSVSPLVPETEMVATLSMCSLWCSWCCIQRDICPWPVCCISQNARPLLVSFLSVNWLQKFYLSSGHVDIWWLNPEYSIVFYIPQNYIVIKRQQ